MELHFVCVQFSVNAIDSLTKVDNSLIEAEHWIIDVIVVLIWNPRFVKFYMFGLYGN